MAVFLTSVLAAGLPGVNVTLSLIQGFTQFKSIWKSKI